jgi:two-component system sensor histidine kinase HydH
MNQELKLHSLSESSSLLKEISKLKKELQKKDKELSKIKSANTISQKRNKENFKNLAENSENAIMVVQKNGKPVFVNKKVKKITGYSKSEFLKLSFRDTAHPDEIQEMEERLKNRLNGKHLPKKFKTRLIHKNGNVIHIETLCTKIIWNDKPADMISFRDITVQSKKRLLENAKITLLENLRTAKNIEHCLNLGCKAIYDAELFRSSVLTIHNKKREITHLGQFGLDSEIVSQIQKTNHPDEVLTKQITQSKYKISHSYFIPSNAEIDYSKANRYIPQEQINEVTNKFQWQSGDELIVPMSTIDDKIDGYLLVDSPFNNKRPDKKIVHQLEEIADIVILHVHEIQNVKNLIKKEEEWQETFDSLEKILLVIDKEYNIKNINSSGLSLLKTERANVINRKCYEVFMDTNFPCEGCTIKKTLKTSAATKRDCFFAKYNRHFSLKISPNFNKHKKITSFIYSMVDITDLKQTESELKLKKDYIQSIIDASLDMIITTDLKRNIIEFNKAAEKTYGYKSEEVVGKNVSILYTDLQESRNVNKATLKEGKFSDEIFSRRKNGEIFPCHLSASLLRDEYGRITGIMGISRDITKYKEFEQARIKLAEEFKNTIKGLHNQIYRYKKNEKGEYIVVLSEGKLAEEFGLTTNKIKDKTMYEIFGKELYNEIIPFYKRAFDGETVKFQTKFCERWFESNLSPFLRNKDNDVLEIIGSIEEITERKKMETQLLRSERLVGIGELAAGIAHEIRNPLANISLSAQLSLSKGKISKKIKQNLEIILSESENANSIIKKLVDFANPREISLKQENINDIIDQAINLVNTRLLAGNIRIIKNYSNNLPDVALDKKWIEQCFVNFLINAIESISEEGEIEISTNLDFHHDSLIIIIMDNGSGISEENLKKIFDPFFTTKADGVGLGLSLVNKIIQNHKGTIDIESQENIGTKVIITFPVTDKRKRN